MPVILQKRLSSMPWMDERALRLPGTKAIKAEDWLFRDECFEAQTAYKALLLGGRRDEVLITLEGSEQACEELREMICGTTGSEADSQLPLIQISRLTQEDWIILQKPDGESEHIATAGLLCFPASWTLSEKIGRPLTRIHKPVPGYAGDIARRVQRMFDGLQPDRPICRSNLLIYNIPELHHPLKEGEHRLVGPEDEHFVRVERQTLRKLPRSGAIVFGIHTSVVRAQDLDEDGFNALAKVRPVLNG